MNIVASELGYEKSQKKSSFASIVVKITVNIIFIPI